MADSNVVILTIMLKRVAVALDLLDTGIVTSNAFAALNDVPGLSHNPNNRPAGFTASDYDGSKTTELKNRIDSQGLWIDKFGSFDSSEIDPADELGVQWE